MQAAEVIPPPPRRKWREFRVHLLPLIVFSSTVFSIAQLWLFLVHGPARPAAELQAAQPPDSPTNLVAEIRGERRGI